MVSGGHITQAAWLAATQQALRAPRPSGSHTRGRAGRAPLMGDPLVSLQAMAATEHTAALMDMEAMLAAGGPLSQLTTPAWPRALPSTRALTRMSRRSAA